MKKGKLTIDVSRDLHRHISTGRKPSDHFSDKTPQIQLWLALLSKRRNILIKVWLELRINRNQPRHDLDSWGHSGIAPWVRIGRFPIRYKDQHPYLPD